MSKLCKEKVKECADWVKQNGLIDYGGAMVIDFCKAMDITKETYYQWMKKSDFADAIKEAKEVFKSGLEEKVVTSLAKYAIGYEWEEVTTVFRPDANGNPVVKEQRKTNKHVPPNTGAAIFLLTNINGDVWKNKQTNDVQMKVEDRPTREQVMEQLERIRQLREEAGE